MGNAAAAGKEETILDLRNRCTCSTGVSPSVCREENGRVYTVRGGLPVQLAVTPVLTIAGMSAYHTSILVGGREYFFDMEGITSAPALWSHGSPEPLRQADFGDVRYFSKGDGSCFAGVQPQKEPYTEVHMLGTTGKATRAFIDALTPFFGAGSYDIGHKNCNTFVDAALYYLLRRRLDGRYNRVERLLLSMEPVSVNIINRLIRAVAMRTGTEADAGNRVVRQARTTQSRVETTRDAYVPNPLAVGFSVGNLIALWKEAGETATGEVCCANSSLSCGFSSKICCGGSIAPSAAMVGGRRYEQSR